jgi:short subunit dehydrogenase-like uncharacterized protein
MIYGANGFTGHLVAVEAKRQGICSALPARCLILATRGRLARPLHQLPCDMSGIVAA